MFRHYFKTAWRNIKRNKATSFINVLGLSIGIATSLIIFMIVRVDTSFDKWEPQNKDIYRLYTYDGPDDINSGITTALPQAMRDKVSGIDMVTHFLFLNSSNSAAIVETPTGNMKSFPKNEGIIFADSDFFSLFPHRWIAGNAKSSLGNPNMVVLSKSSASVFFPKQNYADIIGKRIIFGDSVNATVSGIVDDLKEHSDFDYKIFISYPTITSSEKLKKFYRWEHWGNVSYASNCVVKLKAGTNPSNVEKQLKDLDFANNKPDPGMNGDEPRLLSISRNHYDMDVDGVISMKTILSLAVIALFILILAVINYINLSTAQSSLRTKEVGVRKVFGGSKLQIRFQFLTETFMITLFSALLAIVLTPLLINGFSDYVPKGFTFLSILNSEGIFYLIGLIVLLTITAGFYPALILANFEPIKVLKGNTSAKGYKTGITRKILIITQFAVAQILLVLVIVVGRQVHYTINKDLGYKNKKSIISFYVPDARKFGKSNKYALINKLHRLSGINNISLSSAAPTSASQNVSQASAIINGNEQHFQVWQMTGDTDYIRLFGIPIVAGTNLTTDTSSNPVPVLINETMAKQLGYKNPHDAVDKLFNSDNDKSIVKGVLHDFNFNSIKTSIQPLIFFYNPDFSSLVNIQLAGNIEDWQHTIAQIQNVYKQVYPDNYFDYSFLDQSIEKLYRQDTAVSQSLKWATILAIFISCLGLFGLVTFMANQRRKEIGIRKVLGASVQQIILMLSKSMLQLVIIATLIAFPVAWYFSHQWLNGFAYKINIGWLVFILSAGGMLFIAWSVVCIRAWKAARENPVKSLKTE